MRHNSLYMFWEHNHVHNNMLSIPMHYPLGKPGPDFSTKIIPFFGGSSRL